MVMIVVLSSFNARLFLLLSSLVRGGQHLNKSLGHRLANHAEKESQRTINNLPCTARGELFAKRLLRIRFVS